MRIVICGGGTAGWLAALMIKKIQPDQEITVIESSKVGIVGAGEGSTGFLTDIIQGINWNYGCNEEEFIRETGATVKLGIKHRDWKHVGHTYYGPIDGTNNNPEVTLCHALIKNIPVHTASQNGYFIENNKTNFWKNNGVLENTHSHGYHFDAHRVGKYFKKIVEKDGIVHIDSEILDVGIDEYGINSILLSNGSTVTGDFFIDCTGFSRKLNKALDIKWISYKKNLPVDTAMPFLTKFESGEIIEPVTTAWAQKAGWMWKIPTADRYGCGYVFDSNFISNDQAQAEIETVLGHSIEPIRFLKFETGRLEKLWYKNCLSVGLAAAFAEPLEATSIHSTIVQLNSFIFDYLKNTTADTVNSGAQAIYNRRMCQMYDDFKDFLVLHYQTKRNDSDFWKWISSGETSTEMVNNILKLTKSKFPQSGDFNSYIGYAGHPLWNWVLIGLGYLDKYSAERELNFYSIDRENLEFRWNLYYSSMEQHSKAMLPNSYFIKT
jgi:tryptophan halogenase